MSAIGTRNTRTQRYSHNEREPRMTAAKPSAKQLIAPTIGGIFGVLLVVGGNLLGILLIALAVLIIATMVVRYIAASP